MGNQQKKTHLLFQAFPEKLLTACWVFQHPKTSLEFLVFICSSRGRKEAGSKLSKQSKPISQWSFLVPLIGGIGSIEAPNWQ